MRARSGENPLRAFHFFLGVNLTSSYHCRLLCLVVQLVLGFAFAHAGSFSVSPVRIELTARRPYMVLQITNHSSEGKTIQVQVMSWSYDGEKDVFTRTDHILLNPPIFTVGPGQKQSMRLGMRRTNLEATAEVAYRVILEEVPKPPPPGFQGLQTLLRISIPVFVQPVVPVLPKLIWQLRRTPQGGLQLSATNEGSAHIQFRTLRLSVAEGADASFHHKLSDYLLPGQTRTWSIPSSGIQVAPRFWLAGDTDAGEIHEVLVPTGL